VDPSDQGSLIGLARIHLARNELDACAALAETALRVCGAAAAATAGAAASGSACDAGIDAALLLADVQFLRSEFDAATERYQALLQRHPNSYGALAKLIGECTQPQDHCK
jgi:hypothetical protein